MVVCTQANSVGKTFRCPHGLACSHSSVPRALDLGFRVYVCWFVVVGVINNELIIRRQLHRACRAAGCLSVDEIKFGDHSPPLPHKLQPLTKK
jgi:hypothetical protein